MAHQSSRVNVAVDAMNILNIITPDLLRYEVLGFLTDDDLLVCADVCKSFCSMATSREVWLSHELQLDLSLFRSLTHSATKLISFSTFARNIRISYDYEYALLSVVNRIATYGGRPNVTQLSLVPSETCATSESSGFRMAFSTAFPRLQQLSIQSRGLNADQSCVIRSFASDIAANRLPDLHSVSIDGDYGMSWRLLHKLLLHCPHLQSAGALSRVCPLTDKKIRLLRAA